MRNALLISIAMLIAACGGDEPVATNQPTPATPPPDTMTTPPTTAQSATVDLQPTQGNKASGTLNITADTSGVHITGSVMGLEANSEHGIHIHETGDCSAPDASSAGGHFAPMGHPHGAPGPTTHVGDLGNITADAQGAVAIDVSSQQATLGSGSPTDVMGKAVIVHAGKDDLQTQPSGDSGARIACGVIK